MSDPSRWLYLVVSAAPPVLGVGRAISLLDAQGWRVCLVATPTAATWIDLDDLAARTGCLTRCAALPPGRQDSLPRAEAVLAAPMTFNSINKWAGGISDCLALGVLNELLSADVPILAVPCVKPLLRRHPAYQPGVDVLTAAGVTFLDPDTVTTRTDDGLAAFRWVEITAELQGCTGRRPGSAGRGAVPHPVRLGRQHDRRQRRRPGPSHRGDRGAVGAPFRAIDDACALLHALQGDGTPSTPPRPAEAPWPTPSDSRPPPSSRSPKWRASRPTATHPESPRLHRTGRDGPVDGARPHPRCGRPLTGAARRARRCSRHRAHGR
ncbi:hypothetical protein EKG83_15455 [Saccharothrix syringae]|uniref:Flavoprotein domain-containing protein n=1 Tax=Saccharothrix syringae TaxID=103733 RepID=A0A5Q0GYB9_SACSY|nr:hypothetical protein EKG83_15455 [Saccharothrix syringae]